MFTLTEEHDMLRDAARAFVQDRLPTAALRRLRDAGDPKGFDDETWREIVAMGWTGVVVPEEMGGSGLGCVAMGLVLEELGKTLAATPLLSAGFVGPAALMLSGDASAQARLIPGVLDGSALLALAIDETAHHQPERVALAAERAGDGWRLSGVKRFVADGHIATHVLVAARTSGAPDDREGVSLFVAPAESFTATRLRTIDSRGAADLVFDGTSLPAAALLGAEGAARGVVDAALDRARAGLAAEMLGHAQGAFEMTVDYLKTRVQFGQTIGTFQALQHRAAKMFVQLELARSAVYAALSALDAGRNDAPKLASLAKALAGDALHLVSNETVQMHGGIGMTDAHDAGLYLKRARVAETLYGSASFHRDRYARFGDY